MVSAKESPKFAIDACLSVVSALFVATIVPWADILSLSTPAGGDNPAHPVLVESLREALRHGSIVHYSTKFWGGFELFQFYFPLPYLVGAALTFIMPWQVAYKLLTLFGVIALPTAFYWMCRGFGWSRSTGFFGALLSMGFLYTEAHKMWGGNMSSNLAGMIGNAWGFVFVVIALGAIAQAWRNHRFSKWVVIWSLFAITSHFYMLFLLLLFYGTLFILDASRAIVDRSLLKSGVLRYFKFYLHPLLTIGLMSWWLLPLVYYREFSANFGVNWEFNLWRSYTEVERWGFAAASMITIAVAVMKRKQQPVYIALVLLTGFLFCAFSFNRFIPDTAFINVRLWPLLYFAFYLNVIAAWSWLFGERGSRVQLVGFLVLLPFMPSESSLTSAREWMEWNYEGVEKTPAYGEFRDVIKILNEQPAGRVTFESSPKNNWILGSVRVFEMLPLVTHHEIVEGGLVNSAPFSGVPYSLQCLVSSSCAGWPNGVLVPAKDIVRGIDLMRALGVRYHIAATGENSKTFLEARDGERPLVRPLYQGQELTVLALNEPISLVEVYDGPAPVFPELERKFLTVNLYRYDSLRHALALFDDEVPSASRPKTTTLFNDLTARWRDKQRVLDASAWGRVTEGKNFLNSYYFTVGAPLDLSSVFASDSVNIYVADRSFAPEVLFSDQQGLTTEMLLPLIRPEAGEAKIHLMMEGFRAYDGAEEVRSGDYTLRFEQSSLGGATVPFAMLRFVWEETDKYRFVDVQSEDKTISPGFPSAQVIAGVPKAEISFPPRITAQCEPRLETGFHRMTLTTKCPGKPHLIKYNYYPKWQVERGAADGVSMATHGFMAFTPNASEVELRHRRGVVDWFSMVLSVIALIIALSCVGKRG